MKVALLTNGIYPYVIGGMQKHSYYLVKFFVRNGIEVDLYHTQNDYSYDIDKLEFFSETEKRLIRSIVISSPCKKSFPGHYVLESKQNSEKIFDILKYNLDVDFIYAKSFTAWKLLIEKKKGLKTPNVGVNFHGYEMFQFAPSLKVKLQHFLLRLPILFNIKNAEYVFSYGAKITDIIKKCGIKGDKIIEIPSGIETEWLYSKALSVHKPRRFIFIGRYERRKGIEELTKVIHKIINSDNFIFHFIGTIPNSLKLRNQNIKYHGKLSNVSEIKNILRSSDVLVCPSYAEGMPNVIMEAMASGLAVIATDVGAVSAMVSEQNGWLISPGDEQQLHQALLSAIHESDENLLQKKAMSQLIIEKYFTWDAVIQDTIKQIAGICKNEHA